MKQTLFTKQPLEQPEPAPLCICALDSQRRTEPCPHDHVHYKGRMPCTGPLICSMCLTEWHPDTGKVSRLYVPATS